MQRAAWPLVLVLITRAQSLSRVYGLRLQSLSKFPVVECCAVPSYKLTELRFACSSLDVRRWNVSAANCCVLV